MNTTTPEDEITRLRGELQMATAAREKAEKERAHLLRMFDGHVYVEENEYSKLCNKSREFDDLRRQLEEANRKSAGLLVDATAWKHESEALRELLKEANGKLDSILTDVNYEGGIPWHNARYNDLCLASLANIQESVRLQAEAAQWQAVAMKRREALSELKAAHFNYEQWAGWNTSGLPGAEAKFAEADKRLERACGATDAALSLDPPTALLEIVEAALREGYHFGVSSGCPYSPQVWQESKTRARVMGGWVPESDPWAGKCEKHGTDACCCMLPAGHDGDCDRVPF